LRWNWNVIPIPSVFMNPFDPLHFPRFISENRTLPPNYRSSTPNDRFECSFVSWMKQKTQSSVSSSSS
jgi:hypothetical protein